MGPGPRTGPRGPGPEARGPGPPPECPEVEYHRGAVAIFERDPSAQLQAGPHLVIQHNMVIELAINALDDHLVLHRRLLMLPMLSMHRPQKILDVLLMMLDVALGHKEPMLQPIQLLLDKACGSIGAAIGAKAKSQI